MQKLAAKLKLLRTLSDFKQAYVGQSIGMSQSAYSRIESGHIESISIDIVRKLAELYKMSVEELITLNEKTISKGKNGELIYHGTPPNTDDLEKRIAALESKVEMLLKLVKKGG